MLFLTKWTVLPGKRDEAVKRFMETGAPPPTGVKLLGRWHTLGELSGITIASADDATSMYGWMYQWSDLLEFAVVPVIEDADAAKVLSQNK
jgi:hypothetical protein